MPRPASLAERWRRHRRAFELGLALGITPREAEGRIRQREADAARQMIADARREAAARLREASEAHAAPSDNPVTPERAFANFERLLGER